MSGSHFLQRPHRPGQRAGGERGREPGARSTHRSGGGRFWKAAQVGEALAASQH